MAAVKIRQQLIISNVSMLILFQILFIEQQHFAGYQKEHHGKYLF